MKVASREDGEIFLIKIYPDTSPENLLSLRTEAAVYQRLNHPLMANMVEFKEKALLTKQGSESTVAILVTELASSGQLFDYVALRPFTESQSRYYFKQLLQVLHYLHSNGVAHRDLKPESVLLDRNFNIKLSDFAFTAPLKGRDGSG